MTDYLGLGWKPEDLCPECRGVRRARETGECLDCKRFDGSAPVIRKSPAKPAKKRKLSAKRQRQLDAYNAAMGKNVPSGYDAD